MKSTGNHLLCLWRLPNLWYQVQILSHGEPKTYSALLCLLWVKWNQHLLQQVCTTTNLDRTATSPALPGQGDFTDRGFQAPPAASWHHKTPKHDRPRGSHKITILLDNFLNGNSAKTHLSISDWLSSSKWSLIIGCVKLSILDFDWCPH